MQYEENTVYPPGTVPLIQFQEATSTRKGVALFPQPSDDPNEPLNWPKWRKVVNMALIFGMTMAAFTMLMVQTVFWQQMVIDLDVDTTDLTNAQSAQLAGLAVGCLFFIPLTVKYGRRLTYLVSIAAMAASSWWMAYMHTKTELIVSSILAGLSGAINETAVQMTIADLFFVHQRGAAVAVYFVAVNFGSFLTPLAAGTQAAVQGWRSSYTALSISLTVLFVAYIFCYEETKYIPISTGRCVVDANEQNSIRGEDKLRVTDDERKAIDTLRKTDSAAYMAPVMNTYHQRMRLLTPTGESLWKIFILPLGTIILPHVLFTAIQFAAGVAWLVILMTATSIVFSAPPYSFNTAGVGYMTLGPFVGNVLGNICGGPVSDWLVIRAARRQGRLFEPEMRLYPLIIPVLSISGGLIMFGTTAARGMHWIFPSIGGAVFGFGLGAMGEITFTLVVDTYLELTAEAFVGIAFLRNAINIGIPSALVPWLTAMGLSNMYILAGCIALAVGLLHVPLIIWGKRIRIVLAPRYQSLVAKKQPAQL
ncbi:major facilitator superfamily domain-containing protein [Truncatella angustata]|uniref:Major facilitator superfamily domain-containing protein n=1 Tax=Truncatella angustata TaxID=152316 RepID=A0A9P8URA3_9PEZI|nr:major facilitator superfamily domain-containing protein [Truncatella angustata]KAH6656908.1 major facilitator superfamily domain-containing protein [Truncatella angustata]KAH8194130.1 hypothetical protein TruAng_011701 [Truncatella angustata]